MKPSVAFCMASKPYRGYQLLKGCVCKYTAFLFAAGYGDSVLQERLSHSQSAISLLRVNDSRHMCFDYVSYGNLNSSPSTVHVTIIAYAILAPFSTNISRLVMITPIHLLGFCFAEVRSPLVTRENGIASLRSQNRFQDLIFWK